MLDDGDKTTGKITCIRIKSINVLNYRSDVIIFWISEDILNESLTSKRGQPCSRRHCSAGNLLSLSTSSHVASSVLFKLRNLSFLKQLWGESMLGELLHSHSLSVRPPGDVSASDGLLSIGKYLIMSNITRHAIYV
jgi:hypothetical protein